MAVPTHPDTCGGDISAISAQSASDLWLLEGGGCIGGGAESAPLHWDGQSWTASENCGRSDDEFGENILNGVFGFGADRALMVGSNSDGAVALRYARRCRTLPLAYTTGHGLLGILRPVGPRRLGGRLAFEREQQLRSLIEHWDGKAWTDLGGPNIDPDRNQLTAVATVPGTTSMTWAVGFAGDRELGTLRGMILLHH